MTVIKLFNYLLIVTLLLFACLSVVSCGVYSYYDDRTSTQLEDANYLENNHLNLDPNKHVLLIGFDGVPYKNFEPYPAVQDSKFRRNYYTQSFATIHGWKSILSGNILDQKNNIFSLIKKNNKDMKTGSIVESLSKYYYNKVWPKSMLDDIDFSDNLDIGRKYENFNTLPKMDVALNEWKKETCTLINCEGKKGKENDDYNFIFTYNSFIDNLKHKKYLDSDELIKHVLDYYSHFVENFYSSHSDWLIIVVTDHERNKFDHGFDHYVNDVGAHFSWTLSNYDLDTLLYNHDSKNLDKKKCHDYHNFYDIRTVILNWLSK